jgi:hypothetical protein
VFHCAPPPFVFLRPDLFSKAGTREGRTDHRAALDTSRQAAKDKTCPRWLVGNPAHARTSCALAALDPRQRACSLRHRKPREVALQQPKVAAQLPTGGDVSYPCPCRRHGLDAALPMLPDGAATASKPPRRTACGWLHTGVSYEPEKRPFLSEASEDRVVSSEKPRRRLPV